MRRLNGPAAMCHWVWNQQVRSGMEITDCEKLNAFARPDSLNGRPVQSSGYGPPPRSSESSWLIDCHDPDRSISASSGTAHEQMNSATTNNAFFIEITTSPSSHSASTSRRLLLS